MDSSFFCSFFTAGLFAAGYGQQPERSVCAASVFSCSAQIGFSASRNARITPVTHGWHQEALIQTRSNVIGIGGDAAGDIVFFTQFNNAGDRRLNFRMITGQAHADGEVRRSYKYRTHAWCCNNGFRVFNTFSGLNLQEGNQFTTWIMRPYISALAVIRNAP